ncbi:MAG TPA: succinylglutamate desuccinylase/aspartoacylase family protein [Burkholderiales bacterium]|nr:succinylglutamate desuccinylase/aspartoacylase family protein [Burkholderiales bacterium]
MNRPIEISPPDIEPYRRGNAGVEFVHVLDSGKPGPKVMIQALTHGNEFCGAIALDRLFREGFRPLKGRLVLAFANVAAFARFTREDPDRSRYIDEDYNRVWGDNVLLGGRDSAELRRARELRRFVDGADLLLDLHSMHEPCRPIMVCARSEKSVALARRMGAPADLLLDTGHPAGLRMIERGAFSDPASERTAVLIECGQHWARSSVEVAIDATERFLAVAGMLEKSFGNVEQRVVRVTEPVVARTMGFRFAAPWKGLEVVPKAGTVVARDGDEVWMTPYDDCVMVMPSMAHLKPGTTMVRLGRYA